MRTRAAVVGRGRFLLFGLLWLGIAEADRTVNLPWFELSLAGDVSRADTGAEPGGTSRPESDGEGGKADEKPIPPDEDPESIEDLKRIQTRVQRVAREMAETTVGVSIGASMGSGVIISEDGLVLTAAHVIRSAGQSIRLILSDGQRIPAITLGLNQAQDAGLARITVKDRKWKAARMAPADSLEIGEWCVALGHPGGYVRGRPPVVRLGRVVNLRAGTVQTDCPLIGGDSGGPLFDLEGRVIGIHSRIGAADDWNFHVSIATFHRDWERLLASEDWGTLPNRRNRGNQARLGVTGTDHPEGCRVTRVLDSSAAEKSGIKLDDIITAIDGKPVRGIQGLIDRIGSHAPGDMVEVQLKRDGEVLSKMVILGRFQRTAAGSTISLPGRKWTSGDGSFGLDGSRAERFD